MRYPGTRAILRDMIYGYKTINGTVHISRMSGNAHETGLAVKDGWTLYMTTDAHAYRDGMRLAGRGA